MNSRLINKTLTAPVPRVGDSYHFAHSTTANVRIIPPHWRGRIVYIYTDTYGLYVGRGSTQSAALKDSGYSAATAVGSADPKYIVSAYNAGGFIGAGQSAQLDIGPNDNYICFASTTTGASNYYLSLLSDGDRGNASVNPMHATENDLPDSFPKPTAWFDSNDYARITQSSGVTSWGSRFGGLAATEGTNKPAYTAPGSSTICGRPVITFTSASSHKLVTTSSVLTGILGSTSAFSVMLGFYRGASGAAHTLFSVGTNGSNNGRWDISISAGNVVVVTRVTSGGSSSTSTGATTVTAATHTLLYVYDGAGGNTIYLDRAAESLTGSATGDVGTLSKASIGCRGYNTSTYDQFHAGSVGDVMVWDAALTSAQIEALRNQWMVYRVGT